VAFGGASAATAEPGPVASKQAEAQSIISQINSIETQLSTAVERWNLANVKLARIGDDLPLGGRAFIDDLHGDRGDTAGRRVGHSSDDPAAERLGRHGAGRGQSEDGPN